MKKRVLVVGSANMDLIHNIERVPYSGETIIEKTGSYEYSPGGKSANSAVAFSRIGADTVFFCKLGNDANGDRLEKVFRNEGIDTRFIVRDGKAPTGMASILVEESGKNRIIVFPGANSTIKDSELDDAFSCYPDALFLQFEIPVPAIVAAAEKAKERNIPVFIDAGPAARSLPLDRLGHVTVFSPNETETMAYTDIMPVNEETTLKAAIRLKKMVDAEFIVIKLGEKGAFLYDGDEYYMYPSEKVKAVDTTAAGDVFSAVMTYSYMQNGNIHSAIRMANIAAGISVTRKGAVPSVPTLDEIRKYKDEKTTLVQNRENT